MQGFKNFGGLVALAVGFALTPGFRMRAVAEPTAAGAEITVSVALDGTGDFQSVQQAINSAPREKNSRFVIRIKPGIYREKLIVPQEKGPISFVGEDAATTILTFGDSARTLGPDGQEIGTSKSASLWIVADDFAAQNISFENSFGQGSQAVAVNVWSDRAVFRNCRFLGWQDTLLVNRNRQYFEDCFVAGHVDFIFGAAAAWFERCELHARLGGSITAAPLQKLQVAGRLTTILGRAWRPYASVIFLQTEMAPIVKPTAWDNWGKPDNKKTARYSEFQSSGPSANPAKRAPWSKQLSPAQAAAITPEKVLNGWNPKVPAA